MCCPEYLRLHQRYESTLRRWAQIEMSHRATASGELLRLSGELKQTLLNEKNAAYYRMCLHEENCSVCNRSSNLTIRLLG
jgi:hypothetical protein